MLRVIIGLFVAAACCGTSTGNPSPEVNIENMESHGGSNLKSRQLRYYGGRYGGSRYGGSSGSKKGGGVLGGFALGCIIWCLLPPCLWNNERIAIKQAKLQSKARRETVIADDARTPPIPALEGHIMFVSCERTDTNNETLKDKYFKDVKAKNCIKLRRVVEMYQWVEKEKEKERGDETIKVPYWEKQWRDQKEECPRDSTKEHQNPEMPVPSSKRTKESYQLFDASVGRGEECAHAKEVKLGAYYCGEYVIRELTNWTEFPITAEMAKSCSAIRNKQGPNQKQTGDDTWWVFGSGEEVGDIRVRFEQLACGPLSVNGCLAKFGDEKYTFVPIIHETGQGEALVDEFGCDDSFCPCCTPKAVRFTSDGQIQGDLPQEEMTAEDKNLFKGADIIKEVPSGYADDPKEGDLCCTCCVPQSLLDMMHYIGLEEEYLGVKEEVVEHKKMMGAEKKSANFRHNCCRVTGVLMGWIGALMIISPVTNLLTSNFFIAIMGGALLSCALQICACGISTISATLIIAVAWVRHRPRAVSVLVLAVAMVWLTVFAVGRASATPTVSPTVAPAAMAMTTSMAQAHGNMLGGDGGGFAPAASAAPILGTCGTYTASCPPGHQKASVTTKCASTPCAWNDCCKTATK